MAEILDSDVLTFELTVDTAVSYNHDMRASLYQFTPLIAGVSSAKVD